MDTYERDEEYELFIQGMLDAAEDTYQTSCED